MNSAAEAIELIYYYFTDSVCDPTPWTSVTLCREIRRTIISYAICQRIQYRLMSLIHYEVRYFAR